MLAVQGTHPRVVMEILGHSSITVTMDIYSHVMPSQKSEALAQMDAMLKPINLPVIDAKPVRQ